MSICLRCFLRKGNKLYSAVMDICHYINITSGLFLPVLYLSTLQCSSAKVLALPLRAHQIRVLLLCAFFVKLPNTAHLSFGHSWKMCCGPTYEDQRSLNEDFKTDKSVGERLVSSLYCSAKAFHCCCETEARLNCGHYFA